MFSFRKSKIKFMSKAKRRVCVMIAVAILAAGTVPVSRYDSAMAQPGEYYGTSAPISAEDALSQVTALYEKITGTEVALPEGISPEQEYTDSELKAVMLGCVSTSELADYTDEKLITKQELMGLIYKALLKYNPELAITSDEADAILNSCLDNALVSEENRLAYACMVRYGVIEDGRVSEPNKEISWSGCADILDSVYDRFNKDVYFYMGDKVIYSGDRIENVIEALGEPQRIDKTEYSFEWYVFGNTASDFAMVGVENGLTCAFFTNSSDFKFGDYVSGEKYEDMDAYDYISGLKLITNGDGTLDAVYYNKRSREDMTEDNISAKDEELLDILNVYRAKHGEKTFTVSKELSSLAAARIDSSDDSEESAAEAEKTEALYGSAEEAGLPVDTMLNIGEDVFEIYRQYLASNEGYELLYTDSPVNTALGISAEKSSDNSVIMSVIADGMKTGTAVKAEKPVFDNTVKTVENVSATQAPEIKSPYAGEVTENDDDITIELEKSVGTKYIVRLCNSESLKNDVNAYIVTDEDKIVIPGAALASGVDYTLTVGACSEDGEVFYSPDITFTRGTATNPVSIVAPFDGGMTYDDYIEVTWDSSSYYNFGIDVYTPEDELIVNTFVTNERSALIQDLDPGKYSMCITAFKRGSNEPVGNAWADFEIVEQEPEITEIELAEDEEYTFVYEEYEDGVKYLNFYDEELVPHTASNGTVSYTKKIIKKKIRSTHNYEALAAIAPRPEKTDGKPYLSMGTETGSAIVSEAMKYLGVPYVWGGSTPSGFDCSGFTSYIAKTLGLGTISRTSQEQFASDGAFVTKSELLPGDFIYFQKNGVVHHVGIYIGDGKMIHAPHTGEVVKIQSIETDYYTREYAGAKRIYASAQTQTN